MLSFLMVFLCACGSSKDGSGYLFKYDLSDNPKNLDPQVASDIASLNIIQNIYSGLFRTAPDGSLVNSVAKDYKISDDGLVYEFTLRDDNYWSGTQKDSYVKVTASDFEYGFKRIFDNNTSSPYRETFSCIKNAERIMRGEADFSKLGVYAESEDVLKIELDYPNANFLSLLTSSAAMPCNKELLMSTGGKYGLDSEFVFCNGPFYVKQWEYDPYGKSNYLILRKNKKYSETEVIYPSSLNYFVKKDESEHLEDFKKENTDCIISDGTEKSLFSGKYKYTEYRTETYGIIINPYDKYLYDGNFREALSLSVDRNSYANELSNGRTPASAIIPSGVTILNKSYRELIAENSKAKYDVQTARKLWDEGLEQNNIGAVSGVNILVCSDVIENEDLNEITEQWQKNLEFYCGIESVTPDEYTRRLDEGNYSIALVSISGSYNSPESFLKVFSDGIAGYSNGKLNALLKKAEKSQKLSECVEIYSNAEDAVIEDYEFIPLFYQSKYLVYNDGMTDFVYNPFTEQIDFIYAKNFDQ